MSIILEPLCLLRKYYCYHQNAKLLLLPFKNGNFSNIALNLFTSIFVWVLYIGSWLLFCIASHKIIALRNSCRFFNLLKALARSNGNLFAIAFKSDNYRYRDCWKSDKQITDTKKDAKRIKNDNFLRSNREKSNIAIVFWW